MKEFPPFLLMTNVIQDYAWGSKTSLATLFDYPNPQNQSQAEVWMGVHKNGCSHVTVDDEVIRLDELIQQDIKAMLGERTAKKFEGLPYLFKILAADKPLSIQVHPSKKMAEKGFLKENQEEIPLSAGNRNYKDANHKPELVYALTPYQALNGFRSYQDIIGLFNSLKSSALADDIKNFSDNRNEDGLKQFFQTILSLEGEKKDLALTDLRNYVTKNSENELAMLIADCQQDYPHDVGLFVILMLHYVTLQPGEAMFLYACTPHAYVSGTGLEIMANSDNVLRAGLTPKYIDIPELIANTAFMPKPEEAVMLSPLREFDMQRYPIPVDDFKFNIYQGDADIVCESAEMILAIDSDVKLVSTDGQTLTLKKGQSAFVPYITQQYKVLSGGFYARAYN